MARGDEYLWGRDLLVAPVTEKGAVSRQVYLPRGLWFWTEAKAEGGSDTLYEDDGLTFDYRQGEWMGRRVREDGEDRCS